MKIKAKLMKTADMPEKKTEGACCFDLSADSDIIVRPHRTEYVHTGVCMEIPTGYAGLVFSRSSLHKKSLCLANSVGVIDSDYRGEIIIAVRNTSYMSAKIEKGERVAQLMIIKPVDVEIEKSQVLSKTKRDSGAFGSTGE